MGLNYSNPFSVSLFAARGQRFAFVRMTAKTAEGMDE
jgi:hypothetical protein